MFGIYYDMIYKNVNYVVLLTKWYIHRDEYFEWKRDFFSFLIVFKSFGH